MFTTLPVALLDLWGLLGLHLDIYWRENLGHLGVSESGGNRRPGFEVAKYSDVKTFVDISRFEQFGEDRLPLVHD